MDGSPSRAAEGDESGWLAFVRAVAEFCGCVYRTHPHSPPGASSSADNKERPPAAEVTAAPAVPPTPATPHALATIVEPAIDVPPPRQLLITDLGLESEAMRFAILQRLMDFLKLRPLYNVVWVCRNCYAWLEDFRDIQWRLLGKKLQRNAAIRQQSDLRCLRWRRLLRKLRWRCL